MKKLSRVLAALLFVASLHAEPAAIFSQVDEMLAALTRITGWEVKRAVPREILSREDFAKMVEEGVQEAENDKDVHAAELTLKMLGLAPWDFNLARESGDLMTEQAAAFYDFKKKRLFILDTTEEGNEQRIALVHELAHALADQQYSLKKYMDKADTDDATMARQSVVEGQASWLSWAYLSLLANGRAEVPRDLVDQLADAVGGTGEEFPVLARVPLYLRESLVFPYSEGMRFQDSVYRADGMESFDLLFKDPPRSTEEILHPETYRTGPAPTEPELPKLNDELGKKEAHRFKKLADGDVGEFDYSAILRQYGNQDQGAEAASHWRGGSYALYEHKKDKHPLLVHSSDWDSPEAAETFYRMYVGVLHAKWDHMEITSSTPTETRGTGDTGEFVVRLLGNSVQAMEGLHPAEKAGGSGKNIVGVN